MYVITAVRHMQTMHRAARTVVATTLKKSVQVHEDTINDLKREKQQWEEKPQRVAKAGMSMVAKVLITVIVADF